MLDLGWSEVLLILVVALLVMGPKELSRAAFMVGNLIGRARSALGDMRTAFEDMSEDLESSRPKIEDDESSSPPSPRDPPPPSDPPSPGDPQNKNE